MIWDACKFRLLDTSCEEPEIKLSYSLDPNGTTWAPPTVVSNGADNYFPTISADRTYTTPEGGELTLPGRSLLFVRNVGHLMTNDAIVRSEGDEEVEVFEGIMDALFTGLTAIHGLKTGDANGPRPVSDFA